MSKGGDVGKIYSDMELANIMINFYIIIILYQTFIYSPSLLQTLYSDQSASSCCRFSVIAPIYSARAAEVPMSAV